MELCWKWAKVENEDYQSVLAPFIKMLVAEKRSLGYKYKEDANAYRRFDRYWLNHGNGQIEITQSSLADWLKIDPNQSLSYHARKCTVVRNLTIYMNTLGHHCYVPLEKTYSPRVIVHVFSSEEVVAFFHEVDNYALPNNATIAEKRMAKEYPIFFRLLFSCGLRMGEALSLRNEDVDFERGSITILNAKGNKDRLIYLAPDVQKLLQDYWKKLCKLLGYIPYWLFPGMKGTDHLSQSNLNNRFRKYWDATSFSKKVEKQPTPHCFRHTFVVMRINDWVKRGINLKTMLPYLSKYLGHKSFEETYYYYHWVNDAFSIIKNNDHTAEEVIPEVKRR